jgi:hypothetical protein
VWLACHIELQILSDAEVTLFNVKLAVAELVMKFCVYYGT